MQRRADLKVRYDWLHWFGGFLFFMAFIRAGGVMKSQQNIIQKIDAVGMMIAAIKQDVSACAFVDYEDGEVLAASFEVRQIAEEAIDMALIQLRATREACQHITDSHGIKMHMDKVA